MMDNPGIWAGIYLAVAVAFGIGEMATPGSFFLLPFAAGAMVAAISSLLGGGLIISFPAFLLVSFVSFLALRPLAKRLEADTPDVAGIGANRLVGVTGSVIEAIPALPGEAGMVRVGAEEWKADTSEEISLPVGAKIRVRDVRGTRLLVEPADTSELPELT